LLAIFICVNVVVQGFYFVLTHHVSLIPSLNISYFVGIDTISHVLIVLSASMSFLSIAALSDDGNLKHLVISVLFLESTMMGVFSALDLILFYSFWELSLIPLFYILGAFGSKNRIYAAIKFFIYTFLGFVFMLVAIIFIGYLCYQQSCFFGCNM
uniref:proton-conducting transporter transmembrane domain-containing protein n=1 Tax=Campylobacter concisus TaxID=199 RepID=UPI0023DD96A5